jgi:hypothetical protein
LVRNGWASRSALLQVGWSQSMTGGAQGWFCGVSWAVSLGSVLNRVGEGAVGTEGAVMENDVKAEERETAQPDVAQRWLGWLQRVEMAEFVRVVERTVGEFLRAKNGKPTADELRAVFARELDRGGAVTRDEVAAWHRTTVRQVNRWMEPKRGLLVKLPGYGRKAMFDSRVACRLRPKRKEG